MANGTKQRRFDARRVIGQFQSAEPFCDRNEPRAIILCAYAVPQHTHNKTTRRTVISSYIYGRWTGRTQFGERAAVKSHYLRPGVKDFPPTGKKKLTARSRSEKCNENLLRHTYNWQQREDNDTTFIYIRKHERDFSLRSVRRRRQMACRARRQLFIPCTPTMTQVRPREKCSCLRAII
jgi:hypothetical protein